MDQQTLDSAHRADASNSADQSRRDGRLDGLCGLAVVAVAYTHVSAFLSLEDADPVEHPILMALATGANAIVHSTAGFILLFVLSGYFWGQSLRRHDDPRAYLIGRAARLLPVFWVAVVLAFVIYTAVRPPATYPDPTDFLLAATRIPTLRDLGLNLAMYAARVNLPTWVITPMITGAVAVLISAVLSKRIGVIARAGVLLAALLVTYTASRQWPSLLFVFCFLAGSWLPGDVVAPLVRGPAVAFVTALAGTALVCCDASLIPAAGAPTMRLVYTAGAVLLLGAILSMQNLWTWLAWAPFRAIGVVSYSFYLIHLPVMYAVSVAMYASPIPFGIGITGNVLVLILGGAVSYLVARLLYAYVEGPSSAFGRRIASSFRGRLPQSDAS